MLRRPNRLIASGALALCLWTCLGINSARADTDNQALLNRIVELEAQVRDLSQKAANAPPVPAPYHPGDVITSGPNGATAVSSNISAPDMESRLSALETQIRNLTGQVEQATYQSQQTNVALQKMSSDTDFRIQQLEQRQAAMTPPPTTPMPIAGAMAPPDNGPITNLPAATAMMPPAGAVITNTVEQPAAANQDAPATPEELYNRAYSEMQRKEYGTAQQDFKSFLASNPYSKLVPNAEYWLGEIYYAQGNYKLASATFADGYQKFPKGAKAPDNLLKLGLSLEQQNRTKDACTVMRQLVKDYPSAPDTITSGATRGLKRLQCSTQT
jgi:tol-pal system protein YbgF